LQDAVQAVERAALTIVKALIQQAQGGSYLHARFLFEFAGLAPAAAGPAEGESLASLLLRQLREDAQQPPSSAAAGRNAERGLE